MISLIQHCEADFLWKVSLKILNSGLILKIFIHVSRVLGIPPQTYEIFSKDGNVALQLLHDHLKYSGSTSILRENRCFGTFAHSIQYSSLQPKHAILSIAISLHF